MICVPCKLDVCCPGKTATTEAIIKKLKEITDLTNANLVRNANGLLWKRKPSDKENIEWIGSTEKGFSENKIKMMY